MPLYLAFEALIFQRTVEKWHIVGALICAWLKSW